MARKNWSREELIVTFNLYCKIPFGRIGNRTSEVVELANLIGRSPSAVSWKLANFARLDPSLKKRGISGATHGSKSDKEIWHEFNENWEDLTFESEQILASFQGKTTEEIAKINIHDLPKDGKEREALVRVRVNQSFFRSSILASYNSKCCITGLAIPELLNASHIIPWSVDTKNRINPSNGLCLNAIHDRAFDRGLLTITPDYKVKLSSSINNSRNEEAITNLLLRYEDTIITLPDKFIPESSFLEYHNQHIFKG